MKRLHRPDLFTWSTYDDQQQVDDEHVLVGDGWCAFRNGGVLLDELLAGFR